MSDAVAAEFVAEVRQVKTMVDRTVNITLNLPETCKEQAAWLMAHQSDMIQCVVVLSENSAKNEPKRTNRVTF